MAKVTYVGMHDAVIVPMPLGGEQLVEKGGILSTSDAHAASLLHQVTNWAPAGKDKPDAVKRAEALEAAAGVESSVKKVDEDA